VTGEDRILQAKVVEDADHIGRVSGQPITGGRFIRVPPAAQVETDQGPNAAQVAGEGVEGAVLGGYAVQADHGVSASAQAGLGPANGELDLPRDALGGP
jgi:hypothetical protein